MSVHEHHLFLPILFAAQELFFELFRVLVFEFLVFADAVIREVCEENHDHLHPEVDKYVVDLSLVWGVEEDCELAFEEESDGAQDDPLDDDEAGEESDVAVDGVDDDESVEPLPGLAQRCVDVVLVVVPDGQLDGEDDCLDEEEGDAHVVQLVREDQGVDHAVEYPDRVSGQDALREVHEGLDASGHAPQVVLHRLAHVLPSLLVAVCGHLGDNDQEEADDVCGEALEVCMKDAYIFHR